MSKRTSREASDELSSSAAVRAVGEYAASATKRLRNRDEPKGFRHAALFDWGNLADAQSAPPSSPDAQACAALADLNLEDALGGPAIGTSARLVDVPATGLERGILTPSGYGNSAASGAKRIYEYCDVTGYVAPQNKFELKLPLSGDWNQKFFFYACGAFCGSVFGDSCNLGLARGYASATGNGGHDSPSGFDGIWAANAPELQEDFGWRSNHVVTLIAKAITTRTTESRLKIPIWAAARKAAKPFLGASAAARGICLRSQSSWRVKQRGVV